MVMPLPLPSLELLHERFEELEPGVLYNRNDIVMNGGLLAAKAGSVAGNLDGNGYWRIRIKGVKYLRSRIIWKMHYGTDPSDTIDHKDGDTTNDVLENLRDVPEGINARNKGWP